MNLIRPWGADTEREAAAHLNALECATSHLCSNVTRQTRHASPMPTALLVVWKSVGHLNASIGVAAALRRLGYRVIFAGPDEIRAKPARERFEYLECEAFNGLPIPLGVGHRWEDLVSNIRNPSALRSMVGQTRRAMRSLKASILERTEAFAGSVAQLSPDLVIFDPFLLYFYPPIHALGIPAAALSTKVLASFAPHVPPYTSYSLPAAHSLGRARIRFEWLLKHIAYAVWAGYEWTVFGTDPRSLCELIARRWAFPLEREWQSRPISTDLKFRSVPEWVLFPPRFDLDRSDVESCNARYVGHCVHLGRKEDMVACEEVLSHPRLVLCVLTSVFRSRSAASRRRELFIRELAESFRGLPEFHLVISAGVLADESVDADRPCNVTIRQSVPTLELLKAAKLLICQGGANIVKEAICHSVPLLVFPDAADQPGMSARIRFHNLGVAAPMRSARSAQIRKLVIEAASGVDRKPDLDRMRGHFIDYEKGDLPLQRAAADLLASARMVKGTA